GIVVEATFRLRPRADVDRVVVARFDRLGDAGQGARAVLGSDLIPSALELADAEALRRLGLGGAAALLLGLDGIAPQVDWQVDELERLLKSRGVVDQRVLDGDAREEPGRARGALGRPGADTVAAVMRWALLPMQTADLMEAGGAGRGRPGPGAGVAAHATQCV